jgi:hypothetical protein
MFLLSIRNMQLRSPLDTQAGPTNKTDDVFAKLDMPEEKAFLRR